MHHACPDLGRLGDCGVPDTELRPIVRESKDHIRNGSSSPNVSPVSFSHARSENLSSINDCLVHAVVSDAHQLEYPL
jgi:hypothetical protein